MKRKEISKELRRISRRKACECEICGTTKNVQNHHLIKVEDLSKIAYYNKVEDLSSMYIPEVDLCDYHHMVWHAMTGDRNMLDNISIEDAEEMIELIDRIDFNQVPEELYDDYDRVVDDMLNAFIFELEEMEEVENERNVDKENWELTDY